METQKKSQPTVTKSILIGSVAGATEVLVNHPLWSLKTRLQHTTQKTAAHGTRCTIWQARYMATVSMYQQRQLAAEFRSLYRGILPNAASMAPITGIQVGLNQWTLQLFFGDTTTLTDYQRMPGAFIAGIGATTVACPIEMVMTQQSAQQNFYKTARILVERNGIRALYRGLPMTAIRDGIFTTAIFAGKPILKERIAPYCANAPVASGTASVMAGVVSTLVSHAADTLKTIQQKQPLQHPLSIREAAKAVYAAHGVHGFFQGVVPRGVRVISAIQIIDAVSKSI